MNEQARRPLPKFNVKLAEQFGITPGEPDQREYVHVSIDQVPTPPMVQSPNTPRPEQSGLSLDDTVMHVLAEEMDELATRLERYGVAFPTAHRQQMVDTAMALLSGVMSAGTAVSRR